MRKGFTDQQRLAIVIAAAFAGVISASTLFQATGNWLTLIVAPAVAWMAASLTDR